VTGDGGWKPAVKVSETRAKIPNPGAKTVWRLYDRRGKALVDLLGQVDEDPAAMDPITIRHPTQGETHFRTIPRSDISRVETLLVDVMKDGKEVGERPSIEDMRCARDLDLERLDPGVKRIVNPHLYHVSLTDKLWNLKKNLVRSAGGR
jgi:nicotinate phosphoribosyltransferase